MLSDVIWKRDGKGKLRQWQVETEGSGYRTIAGLHGGKLTTTKWTICKPKNVGRSNETTPETQAIAEAKAEFDKKLAREYRRTLPELDFVPTSPMLALNYKDLKKPLKFPVWSQPKLDGIRSGESKLGAYTRDYQPHINVSHLSIHLQDAIKTLSVEFDGELYNHDLRDDFNKISSLVRRKNLTPEQKAEIERVLQYHVYDLPSALPFEERSAKLEKIVKEIDHPMIIFVPTTRCENQKELDSMEIEAIAQGYEGQMVRLNEPYDYDIRSPSLLKRKNFITQEFPFLRVEEGTGDWAGYAKSAIYTLPNGEEGSSGIKGDQDFTKELLNRAFKPNSVVSIRHFGLMPTGGLRFPVAIDFHDGGRVD